MKSFSKKQFVIIVCVISAVLLATLIGRLYISFFAKDQDNPSQFSNFPIQSNPDLPNVFVLVCKINGINSSVFKLPTSTGDLDVYRYASCSFINSSKLKDSVLIPLAVNNVEKNASFIAGKGIFEGIFAENAFENAFKDFPLGTDVTVTFTSQSNLQMDGEKVFGSILKEFYNEKNGNLDQFLLSGNTSKLPKYRSARVLIPLDIQILKN